MFGSSVIDVVVGLIFVFMTVSLAASALTEAVGSFLKLRQNTLLPGIKALLNDKDFIGLARDLYNHALVNPLGSGAAKIVADLTAKPAYIEASDFAQALLTAFQKGRPAESLEATVAAITDPQIKQAMTALLNKAGSDRDAFLKAIGTWFDDAMDRVSGWYKRYTQVMGFGAALIVAIVLNADAIRIANTVWLTPSLRAELSVKDLPTPAQAIDTLDKARLLGWQDVDAADDRAKLRMLLGWLIVAGASLFGAPFWFDLLQRIIQVAGVGPSIEEAKKRAAKSGQASDQPAG